MSSTFLGEKEVQLIGVLPAIGKLAPGFKLTQNDLSDLHLSDLKGKRVILNIFPSIDTSTCATSVRKFNQIAASLDNTVVLCISKDLPFAQRRFCGAERIENAVTLSEFRDFNFSNAYGVTMMEGRMHGLMCRALVVIDENGIVLFNEIAHSIGSEPNYEGAIGVL